jgi:MFS family permease
MAWTGTGWPVVFACFCLALFAWSFGFYGQAVFLAGLQQANGWPTSLVSAATTLYYLVGAIFLAFVSEAQERLGRRGAILLGMALMAGSVATLPLLRSVPLLFAVQLTLAAGWALTSGTAISAVLAPWFGRRRGLAISLALNGASAAGFTVTPLLIRATASWGFAEGVWVVLGATGAVVAMVVLLLVRPPSETWLAEERRSSGTGKATGSSLAPSLPELRTRREAFGSGRFWLVAMPFGLGLLAQVGFIVHQVAFLLPQLGPDGTGLAVALTTIAAVTGRIGVAAFVDRLDRRWVTAVSFLLQAMALGAMLLHPAPLVIYAGCFLFGLSVGNAITLPALMVLDEFAAASFGMVLGLVTASNQFLYAFGPLVLGLLRDLGGGYAPSLIACMVLEIAAAVLVLVGRPPAARGGEG